jgi:tetratricopeptide (TPR) repeat protein
MVMRKLCSLIECLGCCALIAAGGRSTLRAQESSTTADSTRQATAWAEEAVQQARSGKTEDALALFRKAVPLAPNSVPVLRDYAVVLGWGEHYKEAAQVIHQIFSLEPEQPDWALGEYARSYLFGGDTKGALDILNRLVSRGDSSEPVLLRRALALRWLAQPKEAQTAYEVARDLYPASGGARAGIVYCLGDQNKLSEALRTAETGLRDLPNDPDLLKAKIRVLNWMSRHLEAQQVLDGLPAPLENDREILEDRVYAARWGGDPNTAANAVRRLDADFPGNAATKQLVNQVELEYGASIAPNFRYISDSDGMIDKTWSAEAAVHLTPAHELRAGYLYRELWQGDSLFWRRYDLGWSGVLSRRIRAYASGSDVNYGIGSTHRIIGDGGLAFVLSDTARITAGGGSIVMDAFQAAQNHVTATFASGDITLAPTTFAQMQARYARYIFSDGVTRDRTDLEALFQVHSQPRLKLRLGWRSNLMWHDAYTLDFYSPQTFQSHLALGQVSGRLSRSLDYWVEVGGGWQMEPGTPLEHPVQISGRLAWHPTDNFRALIEVVRTTSSLDRVTADANSYTRRVASVGFSYSFR